MSNAKTKENSPKPAGQPSILSRIFRYAGEFRGKYTASVIIAIAGVVCEMIPFFLIGSIINKLISGERGFDGYVGLCIAIGAFWTARVILHTISTSFSHKATFTVLGNIRKRMCEKLAKAPLGSVLDIPSGELKSIMIERVDSMETTLAHILPEFTANFLAPICMLVILFFIDWRMALISLITLPVGLIFMAGMMKGSGRLYKNYLDKTKVLNDTAVEYINGIEVIKAFGKSKNSYEKFVKAAYDGAHSCIDWMRASIWSMACTMSITPATLVTVLPIGGILFMTGSLPAEKFILTIILAVGLINPLIVAMSYMDDITKAGSIFDDVESILDMKEQARPVSAEVNVTSGDICLNDVTFGYNEKEILHGVNVTIPEGKVTALVGPSGSGKSTIAKLIAGLWDVDGGSITFGGVNVNDIPIDSFNSRIAYVAQDNYLFDLSVRENIRMGNPQASDEEVEEIAKLSGCHDFIMQLESGYDTFAGGAGGHLSGGERQRITIARAMLKDAPVVILDEATAYTDPENEAIIQQSVAKLVQGKTLIVIAHRLSTIADADRIVVINDGRVEACGTQGELLERCALYRNMWEAHVSARDGG